MSDEGERTCPLCAEEMDLTDQQLKPCKCGYEICVWCWHHIMEMAEKDDIEGRCPACRSPYNKEKIVGTAARCERLVSEINMEKKFKTQKGKPRTSEGRKQLTSMRVIQRNLVYIVGLPLNLADEDLLQRKEYFAQYGKVQKVSISRTAAGAIQQFTNNTCSVYITYSKEEEAVRCIQSVHGFVLEGRPLRACFGTTKYCHAWIRNVPCTNPDCLYLHEVGSQEDSFSKDEIISAYTRVQQITSVSNSIQRRSGNLLPAPADDYSSNSSASTGKPISKSVPNTSSGTKSSPPNSSSGRSVALPAGASWGTRSFNNQLPSPTIPFTNLPQNQKPDTSNGPVSFSMVLAGSNHIPQMHSDVGKKLVGTERNNMAEVESKPVSEPVSPSGLSGTSGKLAHYTSPSISTKLYGPSALKDKDKHAILLPKVSSSDDTSSESSYSGSVKDATDDVDETVLSLSSDMLSMNVDKHQSIEQGFPEQLGEPLTSQLVESLESTGKVCASNSQPDSGLGLETVEVQVAPCEEKEDVQSFDSQRLKDPEVVSNGGFFSNTSHPLHLSHDHRVYSSLGNGPLEVKGDRQFVDSKVDPVLQLSGPPFLSSGYQEKQQLNNFSSFSRNGDHSYISSNNEASNHILRLHNELSSAGQNPASDIGESSIISNILSLDYDTWGESLTSPQNLAKFLGETDNHQISLRVSSPWRIQQSNQSRFSFAREEEPFNHVHEAGTSLGFREQGSKHSNFGLDFANKGSIHGDKFGTHNGFSFSNTGGHDMYTGAHSLFNSNKLAGARSQVAAPPGFATPNRAPPGFVSHERVEQTFNSLSGHHMHDSSSFRNQYQSTQSANSFSNGDIEFMDPAILAVGKGRLPDEHNGAGLDMRSSFSPQVNSFENDASIQLLLRRSLSSRQNQRFSDMGDAFASLTDSIRNPSRVVDQSLSNGMPPFSQISIPLSRNPLMSDGHWDGWNEVQSGNNLGVTDILRPERFSYNKYFTGYEDSKLRMPGQSDIYNRTFGL